MKFALQALAVDGDAKKVMVSSDPKLPKGKRYTQIEKAAENYKLAIRALESIKLKGRVMTVKDVAHLTRMAADILNCESAAIRPLIQDFLNVIMDAATIDLLAWQIAGNRKTVKDREVSLFNNRESERCWMAGIVLDIVTESYNKLKATKDKYAKIKLLDGPGAGFIVYVKMPEHKFYRLSYILGTVIKGSDKRKRWISNVRQSVLSHVLVYTNGKGAAYQVIDGIKFKRIIRSTETAGETKAGLARWVRATAKQKKHNKSLFEERMKPCVNNFKTTCYECSCGYDGPNSCFRACRPKTISKIDQSSIVITVKGKNLCQRSLEEI
jgi:hypothetical protein